MTNEQKKYCIGITDHYRDRFRERIARSKRIELFATEAFYLGKEPKGLDNSMLRNHLEKIEDNYNHDCMLKVYKGFVHVFDEADNTAVTVYRVPKLKAIRFEETSSIIN